MDTIIEKYKEKLIDLLIAFDKFCTENNLNYYASGGTAIGVVRHKGFIPWDDDIDVVMPRADYNRMIELRNTLDPLKFCIKTLGDEDYYFAFGKFCDAQTTLIEHFSYPNFIIGAYIDIFPIDEVVDDLSELKKKRTEFHRLRSKLLVMFDKTPFRRSFALLRKGNVRKSFDIIYYKIIFSLFLTEKRKIKIIKEFEEYEKKWQLDKGTFLYNHSAFYPLEKELLAKEWFEDYVYMPFESTKIRMMKGYDKYLTQLFGDYMTPPPVDKQVSSHSHYYLNLKERLSKDEIAKRINNGEHSVF